MAAELGEHAAAFSLFGKALALCTVRDQLDAVREDMPAPPSYAATGWFLHDCLDRLAKDGRELMHFVTGPRVSGTRLLDRIVEFELERREVTYVSGKHDATHRALLEMEDYGHQLQGWFHIHPGSGAGATRPSSIDLSTQERFERGGYPLLGAIFTRDGYVRFFSLKNPLDIEIIGHGAEQVDEHIWRLTDTDSARCEPSCAVPRA